MQARKGQLHLFLPYTPHLTSTFEIVNAVEDTCAQQNKAVWLEGYLPTLDSRLRSFSVTPDPGVLEVNLPPASNWDELERMNTLLAEGAKQNRLTAER